MADSESNSSNIDVAVQEQLLNAPSERNISKRLEAASLWAKFTAEHLMRHCPYTVAFDCINTSLWGIPAPEDADETHATTWVAKTVHDYHVGMAWDETLYFDYQWDFEGWTRELFQKVERNTLRSLKTVLRYRGVYTGNLRARVVDSLFDLLGGENPPEWDPVEFKVTKFDERSEAYQRQQNSRQAAPADRQQQQDDRQGDQQDSRQGEQYRARQGVRSHPQYQELQQPPYAINAYAGPQPRQTEQAMQPQQWYPQTQTRPPATAYREVTPFPQQPTNRVPDRPLGLPHDPYKTLPPRWSRNDRLEANTITQFSKLWDNSN
ncbi:repeatdomain containing protein, partial [Pyrenophora tritici-repentis]